MVDSTEHQRNEAVSTEQQRNEAVDKAVEAVAKGEFVVVVDPHEGAEECHLVIAAEHATSERVAFLIRNSAGIVCAGLDADRLKGFGLAPAASGMNDRSAVDFYVSTDFITGAAPAVSAAGRSHTLRAFCDPANHAKAFRKPGHTFPVCVDRQGLLVHPRLPEAGYDLCRLAKVTPVSAFAQLMRLDDGAMLSASESRAFAAEHGLPVVTLPEIVAHRRQAGSTTEVPVGQPRLESESKMWIDDIGAECSMRVYSTSNPSVEIVTLTKGNLDGLSKVPCRIHSECFTGDILGSKRCDCGQQLHNFLKVMHSEKSGVLLYIRGHEGRGIGLANKIRAYQLQDEGLDTVDANIHLGLPVDTRNYEDSLGVLRHLGLSSVALYTNNPDKMAALKPIVAEVKPMTSVPNERNLKYLQTKRERCAHKTVLETFVPPAVSDVSKFKIGIVYTSWNEYYVNELLKGVEEVMSQRGAQIVKLVVPGASDLVSGARSVARRCKPQAVVLLGVLIKGSSDIYPVTCAAILSAISLMNATQDIPIVSGVLMCKDEAQAEERTHGKVNSGKALAETALYMAATAPDGDGDDSQDPPAKRARGMSEVFMM